MKHTAIQDAWNKRSALVAKANKLNAKFRKIQSKISKLYAEGDKLYAKGAKLYDESHKLYCNAVIATYGPKAIINWRTGSIEVKE